MTCQRIARSDFRGRLHPLYPRVIPTGARILNEPSNHADHDAWPGVDDPAMRKTLDNYKSQIELERRMR
jgi:hypothetical protein